MYAYTLTFMWYIPSCATFCCIDMSLCVSEVCVFTMFCLRSTFLTWTVSVTADVPTGIRAAALINLGKFLSLSEKLAAQHAPTVLRLLSLLPTRASRVPQRGISDGDNSEREEDTSALADRQQQMEQSQRDVPLVCAAIRTCNSRVLFCTFGKASVLAT